MTSGLVIVLVAVVAAVSFGGYRALTDGGFRARRAARRTTSPAAGPAAGAAGAAGVALREAVPDAVLGERATLLQFSSAFCTPCRATRRTLGEVAAAVPGVVHLEVDAEHHLELVRRLDVLRTPTTLVLDAAGHEVTRAAGAPRKEQVLSALAQT